MGVSYYSSSRKDRLAYVHIPALESGENLPTLMFLGGFKSDMDGTKAQYLEAQCRVRGQGCIRFDYSGHGQSSGEFMDGTLGRWKQDALDVLDNIISEDVVLVGSSMGGWVALLLLLERPKRVRGVIGIAAAPDFTKEIESRMGEAEWAMMDRLGHLEIPNDYSDEPYIFTRNLLEDGRKQSLLHDKYEISVPLILIQGKRDADVPWKKSLRIQESFHGPNTEIIFVTDGDHRLSRDVDLRVIDEQVKKII